MGGEEISKLTKTDAYRLFHEGALALADVESNGFRIDVDRLDKTIDNVEVVGTDSEMIITLSDGSTVELIIDSIYMNIQDLDD